MCEVPLYRERERGREGKRERERDACALLAFKQFGIQGYLPQKKTPTPLGPL